MATSPELGVERDAVLPNATIRYRERGDGPPVVFVHGLLVNGDLWRGVVPSVAAAGLRCITPDWPLGSHELAVPDADLSPPGLADLIAQFLDVLDLHDVTIVANDTGGAITQILLARHPERIARVVLTPCDCFENFLPPLFAPLKALARMPGGTWMITQSVRPRALRRLPIAFGWLSKRRIADQVMDSYLRPSRVDRKIRADLRRVLLGIDKKHTLAAAEQLPGFRKPVLLAWATEDRVFPMRYAQRLAETFPNAELLEIADSYTFVPEDQPAALATAVAQFARANASA